MGTHTKNRRSIGRSTSLRSPHPETDWELYWLFNHAEAEVSARPRWNEAELPHDAYHRASIIVGWLEAMPPAMAAVLVAAYQPRAWPGRFELRFRLLAGVVATLPSARAGFEAARERGAATTATSVASWVDELIARGEDEREGALRAEACGVYERALAAYRVARGNRASLVEDEEMDEEVT